MYVSPQLPLVSNVRELTWTQHYKRHSNVTVLISKPSRQQKSLDFAEILNKLLMEVGPSTTV